MLRRSPVDWPSVREKVKTLPWAREESDALQKTLETQLVAWPGDPPTEPSEWYHFYFCGNCGVKLGFRLDSPHRHVCPACGREYGGEPFDGAWRKQVHWTIVSAMQAAAILLHLPGARPEYAEYLRRNLLFYAEHYGQYAEHGEHAGRGKVFPQALTEAIFLIDMEELLAFSSDLGLFSEAELAAFGEKLFRPGLQLISGQQDGMPMPHNIQMWYQACRIACASFLDEPETLADAVRGPRGWLAHAEKGLTREGFWYELSLTYHYYTFQAFLRALRVLEAHPDYRDVGRHPAFRAMAGAYAALAYPDGSLPAYNDSWFGGTLGSLAGASESLWRTFPEYGGILGWLMRAYPEIKRRGDALLYGPAELPEPAAPAGGSRLLPDTGIAVLQNDRLRVTLKNTGSGGGHDHRDQCAIEVWAGGERLSWDPGTAGYGCAFTREWLQSPLAHNLWIRNGEKQRLFAHGPVKMEGNAASAVSLALEGAEVRRRIALLPAGYIDEHTFEGEREEDWEWAFRCLGEAETDIGLQAESLPDAAPYSYLSEARGADVSGPFEVAFRTGRQTLRLRIACSRPAHLLLSRCPAHDASVQVSLLLLRVRAASAQVRAEAMLEQ